MSEVDPEAGRAYTLERSWYGDQWRVDDEGYLHTGSGSSQVERITITHAETATE